MLSNIMRMEGWYWYLSENASTLNPSVCGKWMAFFGKQEFADNICYKAIVENICPCVKCTDMETTNSPNGAICFYINGDDPNAHKIVLDFMLRNNLVRRTKQGKLYNVGFKFDFQTRNGEYGDDFTSEIKLEQFVDLDKGILKDGDNYVI